MSSRTRKLVTKAPMKRTVQSTKTKAKGQTVGATQQRTKSTAAAHEGQSKDHVEPSREELAILTIQCALRQLLARRALAQKQTDKQTYLELMERLEKEAFVAMVRRVQEEAERQRKKEEEERKRKKEEQLLQRRLLEAAFDGEAEEVLAILKEVSQRDTKSDFGFDEADKRQRLLNQLRMINVADANGNTAVSEAAGGGQPEVITLLVQRGADVNTKGTFGRTPLYRAAFGGHLGTVQTLLQMGADPRIQADDGCTPEQVASGEALVATLQGWDLSVTDTMLTTMEAEKQRRLEEEKIQKEAETDRLKGNVELFQKEHERSQRELQKAYIELNKRITEHDKCERKGMEQATLQVTLQVVHDAEDVLMKAQLKAQHVSEQLSLANLTLREQSGEDAVLESGGVRCLVRDLDEVLIKDVGGKIKRDGRWPLLVDPSGQATTFLRYRDTNYLDAMNPENMQPDKLRLSLLGAIRYGKPLVINMMEVDLFETVENQLEQVKPGLSGQLMTKEILLEERYLDLVRTSDGPQYSRTGFLPDRIEKFTLVMVTKQRHPSEILLTTFYPIEVVLP